MNKNSCMIAKRLVAFLFAVIFACALFASCQKTEEPKKDAKVDEIYDELIATGNFTELSKVPEYQLMDGYGIDASHLKQWVMAFPLNYYEDACQISIFEVNDESYAAEVAKKLSSMLTQTKNTAKGYSDPEKAKVIEQSEVVTVGNFVYCIAGKNYNDLMKIMKKYIG